MGQQRADEIITTLVDIARDAQDSREVAVLSREVARILATLADEDDDVMKTAALTEALNMAMVIPGSDSAALTQGVIASGDHDFMMRFARDDTRSDTRVLQEAIERAPNTRVMFRFARHVPDVDFTSIAQAICRIGDGLDALKIARQFDDPDIDMCYRVIEASEDTEAMSAFAREIDPSRTDALRARAIEVDGDEGGRLFDEETGLDPQAPSEIVTPRRSHQSRPGSRPRAHDVIR